VEDVAGDFGSRALGVGEGERATCEAAALAGGDQGGFIAAGCRFGQRWNQGQVQGDGVTAGDFLRVGIPDEEIREGGIGGAIEADNRKGDDLRVIEGVVDGDRDDTGVGEPVELFLGQRKGVRFKKGDRRQRSFGGTGGGSGRRKQE
jgi:hypothetical protein